MGCTAMSTLDFISGGGTVIYDGHPAPCRFVSRLEASAEACLRERCGCLRERDGIGTCCQALPYLLILAKLCHHTGSAEEALVKRPQSHIPWEQCPNNMGPQVIPGHQHPAWPWLNCLTGPPCHNERTPCQLKTPCLCLSVSLLSLNTTPQNKNRQIFICRTLETERGKKSHVPLHGFYLSGISGRREEVPRPYKGN